jgi:arabinogalactan oligomer/maltooligosaccharide transport system permease protein
LSTLEQVEAARAAQSRAQARRGRRRIFSSRSSWWRHLVAFVAIAFALFPIVYVVSAAFNSDQSLASSSLFPRSFTLDNFRELLSGETESAGGQSLEIPYLRWFANTLIVASGAALLTVMLGALSAYAFSRFRFKGRRIGMMTLLLIQMFPQFLAVVAIYLILLNTGEVFPTLGLNSLTGLLLVYLGGAMGVNAWLMKGFFDTIPAELDESARVDGATPAQVFWGIILPLAAPVLAVTALISFISTINEFILASAIMQTQDKFTLPVGMQFFVDQKYAEEWGTFAAGALLAAIPVVILFMALQRFIVHGLTGGAVKG